MFRDVQGLPFTTDGVSPDFVQAGEPRLVRYRGNDRVSPARAVAALRVPTFRRLLRTATS